MKSRRWVVAGLIVTFIITVCFLWPRPALPPARDHYAGWTRDQIIASLGEPTHEWDGPFGHEYRPIEETGPCKSMTFDAWGGTIYLSIHEKEGRWICYTSDWLPSGGVY